MITYTINQRKFNYRVAGLAIHEGKMLIHKFENQPFWCLPGGRVEMGEDSVTTLLREFQEELGESVEIDRLLWICENFYEHMGLEVHEICFYFKIDFSAKGDIIKQVDSFKRLEIDGSEKTFKWVPLENIMTTEFFPEFIKGEIYNLPTNPTHIIIHE